MTMIEKLTELRAEREELTRRIKESATALFSEGTKTLFEKNPRLGSFTWMQYTPYFNDGEPCEFAVNRDYITVEDIDGNEDDEVDFDSIQRVATTGKDWRGNPRGLTELELMGVEIGNFMDNFTDEEFLMMFDDHARVTVSRDGGVSVKLYDHD